MKNALVIICTLFLAYVIAMTSFYRVSDPPGTENPTVVDFSAKSLFERVSAAVEGYDPFPAFPEFTQRYVPDESDGDTLGIFERIGNFFFYAGQFFVWTWDVTVWEFDSVVTSLNVVAAILPVPARVEVI